MDLCDQYHYPMLVWPGKFLMACTAAACGDHRATRALADQMEQWAGPRRAGVVRVHSAHVRALSALGQGNFEEAYQQAAFIAPAGTLPKFAPHALWTVLDPDPPPLRRAPPTRQSPRTRATVGSAAEIFQRLGAAPWADRASQELRACGSPGRTATPPETAALTPQQQRIACLVATGLSNKQIAEKLFLSPRTVSTHLYQLFPKPGVTSRAALRDALERLHQQ
ncbi:helix-turn-helix transcriptional regulator [Streptomyces mirabilis]|uniref:helix-turn-helix transcriptional regulator n=1 Tax=Streptomyces mirabilis TaxID=68239 RepID=UPI0036DD8D90